MKEGEHLATSERVQKREKKRTGCGQGYLWDNEKEGAKACSYIQKEQVSGKKEAWELV